MIAMIVKKLKSRMMVKISKMNSRKSREIVE